MNATDLAALVAWVRAGDERDLPPRIDQAAELCAAFPHTPRPDWWLEPDQIADLADYWPQIGREEGTPGPGLRSGHPRHAIDLAPLQERRRFGGCIPTVTWRDIIDNTFRGDNFNSVAKRVGLHRKSLTERVKSKPERLAEFNAKRGYLEMAQTGREVMA